MTREEAITTLKEMHDSFDEIHENTNYEIGYEQMTATEMAIEALKADAVPTMTEKVREALMRLTMCAREECGMCKYKNECGFNFQYNISTENMHTILDALSADAVHGEWIKKQVFNPELDKYIPYIECSVCGYAPYYGGSESKFNYCPNCGARMKGGDTE